MINNQDRYIYIDDTGFGSLVVNWEKEAEEQVTLSLVVSENSHIGSEILYEDMITITIDTPVEPDPGEEPEEIGQINTVAFRFEFEPKDKRTYSYSLNIKIDEEPLSFTYGRLHHTRYVDIVKNFFPVDYLREHIVVKPLVHCNSCGEDTETESGNAIDLDAIIDQLLNVGCCNE